MPNVPVPGSGFTFTLSLLSQSTGQILDSPTIVNGDVTVSTDGGPAFLVSTLPTVTPAGSGIVEVNLSAAEVGNDHFTVIFKDLSGAEWKTTYYHEVVSEPQGGGGSSSSFYSNTIIGKVLSTGTSTITGVVSDDDEISGIVGT